LQEKYEDAVSQLRSKDLKNAELLEIMASLKDPDGNSISHLQSSYQYSLNEGTSPRQYTDFSPLEDLCNEITKELKLEYPKDIMPRIIHLKEYYATSKDFRKLYKKIAESMIKKLGRQNFTSLPSCLTLWNWLSGELNGFNTILASARGKSLAEIVEKVKTR